MKRLFVFSFLIASIVCYMFGEIMHDYFKIQYSLVSIVLSMMVYFFHRKRIASFTFVVCFCMFLLNRIFLSMLDDNIVISFFDDKAVMMHLHRSLYISLLFFYASTIRIKIIRVNIKTLLSNDFNISIDSIKIAAKRLFYLSSIFKIIVLLEKVFFVILSGGYFNYYINFTSRMPYAIKKISDFSDVLFVIFLSTMPDPKKSKIPFFIFFLFGFLTLFFGQRNAIITNSILILSYIIIYENINNIEYKLISKKKYVKIFFFIPMAFIALHLVSMIRSNTEFDLFSPFSLITTFLSYIGNSIRVIIFGYLFADNIGHDYYFSLAPLTNFVSNNAISSMFSPDIITDVYGQTEEMGLNSNIFSARVTYLYSPQAYLNGFGLGSSYIAEVYHDFGYFGICLISYLYGKIMNNYNTLYPGKWIFNSIIMLSYYKLLMVPRDTALNFFAAIFNLQFVFVLVLVYVYANYISKDNNIRRIGNSLVVRN